MSDQDSLSETALVSVTRALPARTALINRGIALAKRLVADTSADRRRAIAESCLQDASRHLERAFLLWESPPWEERDRLSLRQECFTAYHWGLVAATTIVGLPVAALDADRWDDPNSREHATVAKWLLDEGALKLDIEPCLFALTDDAFEPEEMVINIEGFLDEVRGLLRAPLNTEERIHAMLEEARRWDGFEENIETSLDELKKDPEEVASTQSQHKLTLQDAYRRVVVPKLQSDSRVPVIHEIVLPEFLSDPSIAVFVGPAEAVDLTAVETGQEWVLDWLKEEGEAVAIGEPVARLRSLSGQGELPLPSPVDGVLVQIQAKLGSIERGCAVALVESRRS